MQINIKSKIEQKGISRYELAKRVGVTYPTIDNIYKGTSTSIKFEILEAICRELDCTPNDIVVTDDPKLIRLLSYQSALNKLISKGDD